MMPRLPVLPVVPIACALLAGCIPAEVDRPIDRTAGIARPPSSSPAIPPSVPTSPPAAHPGALPVRLAEKEPVWSAQQVIANARTVAASIYVVQPGDTLRGIGNRTGAGLEAIARANGIAPPYAVRAGQSLAIPGGRYHMVSEGETGIAIAAAYGLPWSRIVQANALAAPFLLRRGQRLLLPNAVPAPTRNLEQRAAAFRIDIDDVLTGGQPALAANSVAPAASSSARPLPANVPIAQPGGFSDSFAWPVKGTILSRFGPGASGARNNGIDIAVPAGTPFRAAADGVVAYAGDKVAVFGGLVLLDHGGGWVSAYGHASRVDVVRGQKVAKGQAIGLTGDSGYASKPKLHFELRKDRIPINPTGKLPPA